MRPVVHLPEHAEAAIVSFTAAQRPDDGSLAPVWQLAGRAKVLTLDAVTFISDGSEVSSGTLSTVAGVLATILGFGVALEFGAARSATVAAGATLLLVGGGYGLSRGRRLSKEGATAPRRTGCYLFEDGLAHYGIAGRYWYPRACILGFRTRKSGESRRMVIDHRNEDSEADHDGLPVPIDALGVLNSWLERADP